MTGQKERILQHLTDFGSITSAEAMQDYGIMRLASRVDELRIPADIAEKLEIEPKEG